mgnify:CR=1 FL=1
MTEWLVDFIQKVYYTMNRNHRTIDYEDKELNDNRMALFLVSILRFSILLNCSILKNMISHLDLILKMIFSFEIQNISERD